jgi:NADH:ubiquinone oxidoreductase subunit 4 (subunit M)
MSINTYKDINKKERALFILPIIFLFVIGILPYYFIDTLFIDIINLLEHAQLNRY